MYLTIHILSPKVTTWLLYFLGAVSSELLRSSLLTIVLNKPLNKNKTHSSHVVWFSLSRQKGLSICLLHFKVTYDCRHAIMSCYRPSTWVPNNGGKHTIQNGKIYSIIRSEPRMYTLSLTTTMSF